jgi:hypothetical protein
MNPLVARKAEQHKSAAVTLTPFTKRINIHIAAAQTADATKLKWIRFIAICRRRMFPPPAPEG